MVVTPQIGRKLTYKRRERRLIQHAVQQVAALPAPSFAPKPLPLRTALTGAAWQEAYQEWTQSHNERPDGLTPDMLRREHQYANHS